MLLLRYVVGGVGKVWDNSQEDDGEGVKCQYKMYESRVVTDEVEERRKLTNKLYEN